MQFDRGLSVRQPFAWAICANIKKFENRTWTTDYRGTIAIHASSSQQNVNEMLEFDGNGTIKRNWFSYGAIVGFADIVDIESYGPKHESDSSASGPYCWEMANGRLLKEPILMKGSLNLFKLPPDIKARLETADTIEADFRADPTATLVANLMVGAPEPLINYQELCEEYLATGNHQEAVKVAAQRVVALAPTNPFSYNLRGCMNWTEDSAEQSIADFRRAIELDPLYEAAWINLVAFHQRLKRYQEMLELANKVVEMFPLNPRVYEERSRALYWLQKYNEALIDCDRNITMNDRSPIAWALRAGVKRELGDFAGARKDIKQAILLDPKNPSWQEVERSLPPDR